MDSTKAYLEVIEFLEKMPGREERRPVLKEVTTRKIQTVVLKANGHSAHFFSMFGSGGALAFINSILYTCRRILSLEAT